MRNTTIIGQKILRIKSGLYVQGLCPEFTPAKRESFNNFSLLIGDMDGKSRPASAARNILSASFLFTDSCRSELGYHCRADCLDYEVHLAGDKIYCPAEKPKCCKLKPSKFFILSIFS